MRSLNDSFLNGKTPSVRFKRTLQVNILIAFATLLIITVTIIIGYTYQQHSAAMLELSGELIDQVTDTVIEKTTTHLSPAAIMAQASAEIPAIESMALVDNPDLEAYGRALLELHPQLSGFFIGNEQGDFLFAKRFPDTSIGTQVIDRTSKPPKRIWTYRDPQGNVTDVETTTDVTYDPRQRPWYEGAKSTQQQFWTDIYIFFTDQKPGITAAYPITDADGALVGVIGIDVALDELSQFLQTQQVGQDGVVFIINDVAEIVAYPGISLAAQNGESFRPLAMTSIDQPWIKDAYAAHIETGQPRFTLDADGQRYIASFVPFPDSFHKNWEIGIIVPEDDFVGTIKQTNQVTLLISLGILFVALLSAVFLARSISKPIVQLTDETQNIKNFDLNSNLEIHSSISEVHHLSESISAMKRGLREFQKYVPDELVRQLMKTGEKAKLGGNKKVLTLFFTDITGFTTISENMGPEDLMQQLSDYLGTLSSIIMTEKGTVDKFLGDGLMAFWGAPLPNTFHAFYACKAALRCRHDVSRLNHEWRTTGKAAFPTRIGIHTGETLVGNMGSPERMNYTVVGDSVNLASRLESINSVYGTEIIVSATTYQQVADHFLFRPLDIVTVKGKTQGVLIYELVGENGDTSPERVELCQTFTEGYDAYLAQDWTKAVAIFRALSTHFPHDTPTQIYLSRCLTLEHEPPGSDWKPIVDLSVEKVKALDVE